MSEFHYYSPPAPVLHDAAIEATAKELCQKVCGRKWEDASEKGKASAMEVVKEVSEVYLKHASAFESANK